MALRKAKKNLGTLYNTLQKRSRTRPRGQYPALLSRAREVIDPAFIQYHVGGRLYQGWQQRHSPLGGVLQRHQGADGGIVAIRARRQLCRQMGLQLGPDSGCLATHFGQSGIDLQHGAIGLRLQLGYELQIPETRQDGERQGGVVA